MTTRELLQEAYEDLGILAPAQALSDEDADFGLKKLTRLLDSWNADRASVYATRFATYTLTPALQPHTIGPAASSPTFTVTQRPVSVESANLVLTGGIRCALTRRDAQWWANLTIPALSSNIPTDLYYSPDWPLGKLYLYPVPSAAYQLDLFTRVLLADLALGDTVTFPPGYRDAITLTLEELIAPSYPPAQADHDGAARARARIMANNDVLPPLATLDSGMPGQSHRGGSISWRTGLPR